MFIGKFYFTFDFKYWAFHIDGPGNITEWGIWIGPFRIIKGK